MNQANGGVIDPNHVRNTFTVGAALIDQYDTDDLYDPDPNPPSSGNSGNTITIIDYRYGNPANYVYGIEGMSFDDPNLNSARPPFAPYPPPVRRQTTHFSTGVLRMSANLVTPITPLLPLPSKTLDFASSTSNDRALLDFFTYNTASRARRHCEP